MESVPSYVETTSMSVIWRATCLSSSKPFPPSMSRASEHIQRRFLRCVHFGQGSHISGQLAAWADSATLKHISCMAVISASMFASLFCTSWKLPSGLPNWTRVRAWSAAASIRCHGVTQRFPGCAVAGSCEDARSGAE